MPIEITYIFHNCFILKLPDKTFLFDYPADQYLDEARRAAVIAQIKNTNLYVFSSHNHADHFNRHSMDLSSYTKSLTCILSHDILKKNRQFKGNPSCYGVEADQSYTINDFTIDSFLSNDEGVAFLIHLGSLHIYFGGDLANWHWEDLNKQEVRLLVDYFGEVLEKIKKWPIQIAFSNTDQRLANWAGAAQFMEAVKPRLFVPMHAFGKTESIVKFLNENPVHPGTEVFQYHQTGDSISLEI
jgi:L-ascorbate metabolism protein UlaG (beta-lactamase superfamily)